MKFWLAAAAAVALIGGSMSVAAEPAVGDNAPDFTLEGSDGKTYKLSDFKGKQAVVIAWFPKAFTGGCTKECKSFRADGEHLRKFNVAYFTASCDPQEVNAKFAKSLELDYPILCDPEGSVANAYGVGKPSKRYTFIIGKDGKLLDVEKKVKTDTHGKDVAAKLETLGVEKK